MCVTNAVHCTVTGRAWRAPIHIITLINATLRISTSHRYYHTRLIFRYRRALFSLKYFIEIDEEMLCGKENVVCFFDDIFTTGSNGEEVIKKLMAELMKLQDAGLCPGR